MLLVALAQTLQDFDGIFDTRLVDEHGGEAALQRGVLLDVLAIFVQRGCADALQLAARQGGLEHIAGVNRTLGGARADHGVQFVNEEDDLLVRLLDLLHHALQPLLELAAELTARHQCGHIQGNHLLALQDLRHIAAGDVLGQALDDGGLAHARLPDQHRIVLGAAGQHLHHAAHLILAANHRVELTGAGQRGEVNAVTLQQLVLALGLRVGGVLTTADLLDGVVNLILVNAELLKQPRRYAGALRSNRQEEVFGADVGVAQMVGLLSGHLEQPLHPHRDVDLQPASIVRVVAAGNVVEHLIHLRDKLLGINVHLLQDTSNAALRLLEQSEQNVLDIKLGMLLLLQDLVRALNGFLGLLSKTGIH